MGEGQAAILLNDFHAYQRGLQQRTKSDLLESIAVQRWLTEVLRPGMERAHAAVGGIGDPIQAYCDLLEVRWLLSEQAGRDVGDKEALEALSGEAMPPDSAAKMHVAEAPSEQFPALTPELLGELDAASNWSDA